MSELRSIEEIILDEIKNSLKNQDYWYNHRIPENVISTHWRIENLLDIMETKYSSNGQVHGFDNGQTDRSQKARFEWIADKYKKSQTQYIQ